MSDAAALFPVIHRDEWLIVVNKPAGVPVENDPSGDPSLVDGVRYQLSAEQAHCGAPLFLGIVHRIDRPVGGVVVFARTEGVLRDLHRIFREREVEKRYWVVVAGEPPRESDRLEGYLSQSRDANKAYVHAEPARGRKASRLDYRVVGHGERYTLLEVALHTGRHHQIRAQLAAIGCPIKGDLKYGARRSNPGGGISLFARSLAFTHPVTAAPQQFLADPPTDPLWDLFPRSNLQISD